MTRTTFNRVSLEIPPGWDDNSFVALLGPAAPAPRAASGRQAPVERPTFVLRRTRLPFAPLDLDAFAESQTAALATLAKDIQVAQRGELVIDPAGAAVRAVTRTFEMTGAFSRIRQVHAYLQVGGDFYVAVGTGAVAAGWDALEAELVRMIESLRFAP